MMIKKINIIIVLTFFFIFFNIYPNNGVINKGELNTGRTLIISEDEEKRVTNDVLTNIVGRGVYEFDISDKNDDYQRVEKYNQETKIIAELEILSDENQKLKLSYDYTGGFEVDDVKIFCREKSSKSLEEMGDELRLIDSKTEELEFEAGKIYEIFLVGIVTDVKKLGDNGRGSITVEKVGLTKDTVSGNIFIVNNLNENGLILVEKTVDRSKVFLGELVKYTVKIKNKTGTDLESYYLKDYLPAGLEVIKKSIKVSEGYTAAFTEKVSREFILDIKKNEGAIEVDSEIEISYVVLVKVMAKIGRNSNLVKVKGLKNTYFYSSNTSSATVEVQSNTFVNKGVIFGRTFIDENKNGLYDENIDVTVPGVKIFLENGDYVISDIDGKYSLYGQVAISHVAKIDMKSVPEGAKLSKITNKHSENGESAFINLKTNQLYKINFAFVDANEKFKERVSGRKEILKNEKTEIERLVFDKELNFNRIKEKIERARKEGTVDGRGEVDFKVAKEDGKKIELKEEIVKFKTNVIPYDQLDKVLVKLDNELDFINVKDGDMVSEIVTFQVKGPRNGALNIILNGKTVPLDRIGLSASSQENDLFFLEYNAVAMTPGENEVELTYSDPFGNVRGRKKIKLKAAGKFYDFTLEQYIDSGSKQGEIGDTIPLILKAKDRFGNPITHDVGISIYADKGTWASKDSDKDRVGLQTVSNKNGMAILEYYPEPGSRSIKFSVDVEGKEKVIDIPLEIPTEPFFLNGIFESRLDFNREFGQMFYLFEEKIEDLNKGGDHLYSYRNAFYGEGYIYEDYYLTLSYDNLKNEERGFGYVDPEEYFLVYGDNSVKGYQAKSSSRFYGKLEKGKSYIMYGDYDTADIAQENVKVAKYSRNITGLSGKYIGEKFDFGFFLSDIDSTQEIDKIRGRGISGPYKISNPDIVEGSERIEIITYQSGTLNIELDRRKLTRFEDYTIDYDLGEVYFSSPIPSVDSDFNPIYIEINYEVEKGSGNETHLVYGVTGTYKYKDWLKVSANRGEDLDPLHKEKIESVSIAIEKGNHTFYGEYGITSTELKGNGEGVYLEYQYEGEKIKGGSIYKGASKDFDNSNAPLTPEQQILEFEGEYKYGEKNALKLDGLVQIDEKEKKHKTELYIGNDHIISKNLSLEGGYKFYYMKDGETDDSGTSSININTVGAKAKYTPEKYENISTYLEYEQDIFSTNYKRMGVGGRYEFENGTALYIKHEVFSELQDKTALNPEDDKNRWLVGLEGSLLNNSKYFSEYRVKKNGEDELPEVGTGIKNSWDVNEKLKFRGTFERIEPILKSNEDNRIDTTSLTFGFDYRFTEKIVMKHDIELSWNEKRSLLLKNNYGQEFTESLFFVGKNRYYEDGDDGYENKLALGLAYRDATNDKYNSLNKYELNYSDNIISEGIQDVSHILRTSHSYQFTRRAIASATLAVEYREFDYPEVPRSCYTAYLFASTFSYDIKENWNVGINYFVIGDEDFKAGYQGVSLEVGYLFKNNLWLSLGYNWIMYPPDLYAENLTEERQDGFNLRFRMNIGDVYDRTRAWIKGD